MNDKLKGCLFGTVAAVTYGMNPLFALPLYKEGVSPDALLFYRYGFAFLLLGGLMKWRRQSFAVAPREILPLALVGMLVAFSSLFLFLAFKRMDAGIASTILFVYPVMVAVIMALFFKEKVTKATAGSILLALIGIALLYKGGDGGPLNLIGVVLVIFSALTYAVYIVGVKQSETIGRMPGEKLTFYAFFVALIVFFARLKFGIDLPVLPSWSAVGNVLCLAVITTVISFLCVALAVRCVGPTPTAILGAFEPVTAVVIGVSVFGEQLTFRIVLGIILIIVAVMLIIVGAPLLEKLSRSRSRSGGRAR